MELRSQKAVGAFVIIMFAAPAAFPQQQFRYEAWHRHSRPPLVGKSRAAGTLLITDEGISFAETGKNGKEPAHKWHWAYEEIQQLELFPKHMRLLTYQDDKWKLGADRRYRFDGDFTGAYPLLKARLGNRLVAALPIKDLKAEWEIPVKHLLRFGGTHGVLRFGEDQVAYITDKEDDMRIWSYSDIESVSDPYQLTITTYEKAALHYGNRKSFNFQLKKRLDEARYNRLHRKINQAQGLQILETYHERNTEE
ncbi:MAG TPA: hypothetical protein PLP04_13565 [Bryobacteraceae bacterium]|nr:hypothetical protein [Bryobacteraceae bacterium]